MHTGRKGRYTARISLLMKRSDLGRVRFEAVLRSVHRFVRLVERCEALRFLWDRNPQQIRDWWSRPAG